MQRIDVSRALAFAGLAAAIVLLVAGCNVRVKDAKNGDGKQKVDIESPMGSIHVNTGANIADTGLTAYPGAREVVKGDKSDNESASVSLEGPNGEGMHIVALKFDSDDAPNKVLDYYRGQLKKYGTVTECKGDLDYNGGGPNNEHRIQCRLNDSGEIALAAGSSEDEKHIVNVKPRDKGSRFDVVYIRIRDRSGTI